MSRHFILDGYNVLHSSSRWADVPREKQREQFLQFLEEGGLQGSSRNSLTVILDGHSAALGKLRMAMVRLVFSGDRDADSAIVEWVKDLPNPKDAVVVTNDRTLQRSVRQAGAQIMSCEEFLALAQKKVKSSSPQKWDPETVRTINDELKRIWKVK